MKKAFQHPDVQTKDNPEFYFFRISAECCDVGFNPLQCDNLILDAKVQCSLCLCLCTLWEAERAYAIVEVNIYNRGSLYETSINQA